MMNMNRNSKIAILLLACLTIAGCQALATDPGRRLWARRYASPHSAVVSDSALAVDADGNVFVMGLGSRRKRGTADYVTIKYDSAGTLKWVRYFGRDDREDRPSDIGVDDRGNVYTTGGSQRDNNSYSQDFATIKYDSAGNTKWVRRDNGPENGNSGYDWRQGIGLSPALAVDEFGNIFVTGAGGSGSTSDYITIKYDSDGNRKWVRRYNGPADSWDSVEAIAVSRAGNIFVTGSSAEGDTDNIATIKYDSDGNRMWVRRYGDLDEGFEWPRALAVDADGNVFVAGYSQDGDAEGPTDETEDYLIIKYDSAGNRKWVRRYDNHPSDMATGLAVDAGGNAIVTGASGLPNSNYVTIKYDSDGNRKWIRRYKAPGKGVNRATAIAVDSAGNIFVTGHSGARKKRSDYATIKYDPQGNVEWVKRYSGDLSKKLSESPDALAIDIHGNVVITGRSWGLNGRTGFTTVKYAP